MGKRDPVPAPEPEEPVARVAIVSADAGLSVAMSRLLLDHELHPFGNAAHVVDSYAEYDVAVVAVGTTAAGLETVSRLPLPPRRCLVIGDEVPEAQPGGPRIVRAPVRMDAMVAIVRELTGTTPGAATTPGVPGQAQKRTRSGTDARPTSSPHAPAVATKKPRVDLRPGMGSVPSDRIRPDRREADSGHVRPGDDHERDLVYETEIGPLEHVGPDGGAEPAPDQAALTAEPLPAAADTGRPAAETGSTPDPASLAVAAPSLAADPMPAPDSASVTGPALHPTSGPAPDVVSEPAHLSEDAERADADLEAAIAALEDPGFEIAGEDDPEPTPPAAVRFWPRDGSSKGDRAFSARFDPGAEVLDEALRALDGEVAALWLRSLDDAFDVTAAEGLGALERRAWLPGSHPLFELLQEADAVRLLPEEDTGALLCGVRGHGGGRCVALALRDGVRLTAVVIVGGAGASDEAVERLVVGASG